MNFPFRSKIPPIDTRRFMVEFQEEFGKFIHRFSDENGGHCFQWNEARSRALFTLAVHKISGMKFYQEVPWVDSQNRSRYIDYILQARTNRKNLNIALEIKQQNIIRKSLFRYDNVSISSHTRVADQIMSLESKDPKGNYCVNCFLGLTISPVVYKGAPSAKEMKSDFDKLIEVLPRKSLSRRYIHALGFERLKGDYRGEGDELIYGLLFYGLIGKTKGSLRKGVGCSMGKGTQFPLHDTNQLEDIPPQKNLLHGCASNAVSDLAGKFNAK